MQDAKSLKFSLSQDEEKYISEILFSSHSSRKSKTRQQPNSPHGETLFEKFLTCFLLAGGQYNESKRNYIYYWVEVAVAGGGESE